MNEGKRDTRDDDWVAATQSHCRRVEGVTVGCQTELRSCLRDWERRVATFDIPCDTLGEGWKCGSDVRHRLPDSLFGEENQRTG